MQISEIKTDNQGRELTEHGEIPFPIAKYDNDIWAMPTRTVPWHWHSDCEIVRIREGSLQLEGSGLNFDLTAGQAAFINANVLHAMHADNDTGCRMTNILFDSSVIGGSPFSIFHRQYVLPLLECPSLPLVPFLGRSDWECDALTLLAQLEEAFDAPAFGREFRVRTYLGDIWLLILRQIRNTELFSCVAPDPYIRDLLSFVHAHYSEPLTLDQVAASAGISPRTCSRSFRTQVKMSVFEYIQHYRIQRACELLVRSADSITEIGFAVGFNDASYFTRTFRSFTGKTPRAYRQDGRNDPTDASLPSVGSP